MKTVDKVMIQRWLLLGFLLGAPLAAAEDIAGFWKHAEEPGWIEIRLDEGKGTVVRNDRFPERVGREIVKDLAADPSGGSLWRGLVFAERLVGERGRTVGQLRLFAERLGEYKDAEISLPEPDRMRFKVKVGFMSRTVDWVRVEDIPAGRSETVE